MCTYETQNKKGKAISVFDVRGGIINFEPAYQKQSLVFLHNCEIKFKCEMGVTTKNQEIWKGAVAALWMN